MKQRLRIWWEQSGLKAWTEGKIHLSRGKKLALNLGIIVLAGLWLWGMAGYPLPTVEMEFRRLERQKLLPASQILLTMEERRGEDDPYTVVVGTWEEQVTVGYLFHRRWGRSWLDLMPLEERSTPVPLDVVSSRTDGSGNEQMGNSILFLQVPEEAASAQVLVGRRESGQLDNRRKAWGEQLENGVWLFWLESGEEMHDEMALSQADRALERWTYELILHRGDGSVLLTQSGQLPGSQG